ncbi:MAG: hypothetical protein JWR80_8532 [Bradyrhizobium sp.]|nr:hypothetical protein [Bradyrhizobium sp.]
MRKSNITVALVAEVCARLINRESQMSVQKCTGLAGGTIKKAIAALRAHGIVVETITAVRFDAAKETRLHEIFRTTQLSNRDIEKATGVSLTTVNKSRGRFNAELVRKGGDLPQCECGQYLHHARMCWARHRQHMKDHGVRAVVTLEPFEQEHVRRRLLAGVTMRSEAERTGLPKMSIGSFLRTFTPEERRRRDDSFVIASARRRAVKLTRSIARPRATNPTADPLYAKIACAVPRGIDPALRDDMISEAYLEVLEGRLDPKHLREGVKKVRGKIFRTFANPWGNRSLDAPMHDDGTGNWAESIPDDRALQAFEALA